MALIRHIRGVANHFQQPRLYAGMAVLHVCQGHDGDVNYCEWSPVSSYIATAGGDKVVRIWDTDTGEEIHQLRGHSYYVNSCVFSPNGDLLATCSSDGSIKLWSSTTWKAVGTLIGHKGSVKMCCFSPDGALIASTGGGGDETLRIWDVNAMKCINIFEKHECSVNCCSFASVGWLLASAGSSGEIILSDAFSNRCMKKMFAHDMGVSWVQFAKTYSSETSFLLASVGLDNAVKLWNIDVSSKSIMKLGLTLEGHSAAVYSCHFSPDFKYLVTGSADKSVIIWNIYDGQIINKIDAHSRYVTFCCFSPCGKKISSTSNDKTMKIWSLDVPQDQVTISQSGATVLSAQTHSSKNEDKETSIPKRSLDDVCQWLSSIQEKSIKISESDNIYVRKISALVRSITDESDDIAPHFICPITQEQFQDPVIAADGHTYERSAIMSWLMEGKRRSPVTNAMLPTTILTQNYSIKAIIATMTAGTTNK